MRTGWLQPERWFLAITLLLAACARPVALPATHPAGATQPLNIFALAPHEGHPPPAATQPGPMPPVYEIDATRLDFPFAADLRPARKLLARPPVDLDVLDLWRVNGLFIGMLDKAALSKLMAALPPVDGGEVRRIVGPEGTHALAVSPPLKNRVARITLTRSDGLEHPTTLTGGNMQFLVRLRGLGGGRSLLMLTPHHHYSEPSVIPRLPQAKALDGEIYSDLMLAVTLEPRQVFVIGIDKHPEPHVPAPPATSQPATSQPAKPPAKAPAETLVPGPNGQAVAIKPEHIRLDLGTLLLGRSRQSEPLQSLLLIQVRELAPGGQP